MEYTYHAQLNKLKQKYRSFLEASSCPESLRSIGELKDEGDFDSIDYMHAEAQFSLHTLQQEEAHRVKIYHYECLHADRLDDEEEHMRDVRLLAQEELDMSW